MGGTRGGQATLRRPISFGRDHPGKWGYEDKFSWWRGGIGIGQPMFGGYHSPSAEQKPSIDVGMIDSHLTKILSSRTSRIDRFSY